MTLDRFFQETSEDRTAFLPRSRRGGQDGGVEMTPLIDVTFLLLVFFMVTSNMAAQSRVELPTADHAKGVDISHATVLEVVPQGQGLPAQVFLDAKRSHAETDEEIRSWIESGIDKGQTRVVINAHGKVPVGEMQRVLRIISQIEGITFHFGVHENPAR